MKCEYGKLVKTYRGWKIYHQIDEYHNHEFNAFLPGENPNEFCSPEWTGGTLNEMIDFIKSY